MKNIKPSVNSLHYYPLKSGAGNSADTVNIELYGLVQDRQFMLINADNCMVTARTHPCLLEVTATKQDNSFIFHNTTQTALKIDLAQLSRHPQRTAVWEDTFSALRTVNSADRWFSQLLGEPVKLVYNGESPRRRCFETQMPLNLVDAAPVLLISEDSLNYLNRYSSDNHVSQQFRPNITVQGTQPFAEDHWKKIRIGEVMFEVSTPCSRCILTTFEPNGLNRKKNNEPLATLSQFRRDGASGEIHFGVYLLPLNSGKICCGDPIEVLETQTPLSYANHLQEKIVLVCDEVESVCRDMVTFWFKHSEALPLPQYLAGQHLPITINTGQQTYHRCYTLSSSPTRSDRWSITVKKVTNGVVSHWLHRNMRVGCSLYAKVPGGEFFIEHRPEFPIAFICAGSGITPAMSMLRMLADRNWIDDIIFFYQCQTSDDIAFAEELQQIQKEYPTLKIIITLSHPDSDWKGLTGRFDVSRVALFPDLSHRHIYSCGPSGFMEIVRDLLFKAGLPVNHWHQESFGNAPLNHSRPYKSVKIQISGKIFTGNNQETVLHQAENAGISMACSCRAGVCGKCKVRLSAGTVEQPKNVPLSKQEVHDGYILACSAIPLENLTVEKA